MTATAETERAETPMPNRWIAVVILLMANFMNLIDITIVNVALPTLKHDLAAPASHIEWIVAGYVFAFALLLLPAGRMGDILGRRAMFLAGIAVFTSASALCGLAPSIEWLVAARLIQGAGGAMMTPQTLALVPALFPPEERGGVFSFFAVAAGLASVAGPILGGILIALDIFGLGWRPIFLVNVPLGLIAFLGALKMVPAVPGNRKLGVDVVGILLAGTALLSLLVVLIEAPSMGWQTWMAALLILSPATGFAFVRWQIRQARNNRPQLLPLRLIRHPSFLTGSVLAGVLFTAPPGFFLTFALYLQSGHGLTPLQSGLTTVPYSLGVLAGAPVSKRLGNAYLRQRVIAGTLLLALGFVWLRVVVGQMTGGVTWFWTAPPLLVAGIGLSTTVSPLFQTALAAATGSDTGSASGAVQSFQRLGGAFGVAITGGIFFALLGGAAQGDIAAYTRAETMALLVPVVVSLSMAAFALWRPLPES